MEQSLRNLRIWLGLAVLAALAALALTGNLAPAHRGPVCFEPSGPATPGFGAFPPGGAPACIRLRIG